MKKFNQYLIVSDLDGTFLGEDGTPILKNLEALRFFEENGGLFTIATGRDYRVLNYIFPNAKDFLSCPAILCNGAYLYDFNTQFLHDVVTLTIFPSLSSIRLTKRGAVRIPRLAKAV